MKQLKFVFLGFVFLCLTACEKEDSQVEHFESEVASFEQLQEHLVENKSSAMKSFFSFTIDDEYNVHLIPQIQLRSEKELLEVAAVNLFNQNEALDFIPYMVNNVGLPVWSRAYVDEDNLSVSIPFIDATHNFTKAILVGKTDESRTTFLFYFVERRYLDLSIPTNEEEFEKIKLMIAHDFDLFGEHDDTLYPYYNENKVMDSDEQIGTRTCYEHIHVCGCVQKDFAFKGKEQSTSRKCPGGYEFKCHFITVPVPCGGTGSQGGPGNGLNGNCIGCVGNEGNVSDPIGLIPGGSDTDLNPFYFENITMLQNCVFAGEDDIDLDGEVGGINEGLAGELCESWNYYKKRCLSDEFDGAPLLSMPYDQQPNYQNNPYYIWGSYSATNPGLFDEIMNMEYGCVTSDELELVECISDKYDVFIEQYNLELSESEEKALKSGLKNSGECGVDFEEDAWNELAFYYSQNIDLSEGEYSMPEEIDGLCWNSLVLTKIADGYYIKIANFSAKFHHAQSNTWIDISFPSLCLQSSGNDFFTGESMSVSDVKKSFANTIEAARMGIFTQLNKGVVPMTATIKIQFKASLLLNLKIAFDGFPTINTDALGCPGVPPSPVLWNCN
ncbi:MAG: hypothetical protein AAGA77_01865 [Bacteroidota bacterium]